MKTDVERAYDVLKEIWTGPYGRISMKQIAKIRADLEIGLPPLQIALWRLEMEYEIRQAQTIDELKTVMESILKKVAK